MARDLFPDAVYVLDLYHLKRRIRQVFPEEWESWRKLLFYVRAGHGQNLKVLRYNRTWNDHWGSRFADTA